MKKSLFIIMMFFAFVPVFAQTAPATSQVQKDINKVLKFTNDNYNMGTIPYGKPTEFVVTIENISAAPVTLNNVQVSCGCTTPKFQAGAVIAPGQKTTVTLGFNGSAMGNFSKSATIFLSDNLIKTVSFSGVGVQQ
ncbi:MAG: DUF1573 domain-containing protein [Chitinophagia bacterium]